MFRPDDKVVRKDNHSKVLIVTHVWGNTITCLDIHDDKKPIRLDAEQLLLWPVEIIEADTLKGEA